MKKRDGFTLIELLGVIIVLAAIALITVPIIGNIMKDSRKNSFKASMNHLVQAANNYYADHQLELEKTVSFDYGTRGGKNEDGVELSFSGTKPTGGRVVVTLDGGVTLLDVTNGTYYANYDSLGSEDLVITDDNEIMTRDELTEAIKELRTELKNTKKELQTKDTQLQTQLTSTTTIANTANTTANSLNSNFLNKTYPVGSIYISNKNTNPANIMGGTWVAFGTGRTLVGVNTSDSNFNTVEKTGGASSFSNAHTHTINGHTHTTANHTLTVNEMPSHAHNIATNRKDGTPQFYFSQWAIETTYAGQLTAAGNRLPSTTTSAGGGAAHNHGNTGSTSLTTNSSQGTQSLLQPYITVYMWKRTA